MSEFSNETATGGAAAMNSFAGGIAGAQATSGASSGGVPMMGGEAPMLAAGGGSPELMSQLFGHLAEPRTDGREQADAASSQALHRMARAEGGFRVPDLPLVRQLERGLGTSFVDARIHTDQRAAEMTAGVQAGAVNYGQHIFFAPGRFDVSSVSGQRLLAEELTHFSQHGGSRAGVARPSLGATTCDAETEAQAVAEAAVAGRPLPSITRGRAANVARRGEAPVHQSIIMEAGDDGPGPRLADDIKKPAPQQRSKENGLLEVYSGNFMRDYSQLNVPLVANILSKTPKSAQMIQGFRANSSVKYESVGSAGGESIANGIIRAIAILELGKPITDANVTKDNIGSYRPQDHMDNPMGTRASELLVRDPTSHNNRSARPVTQGADTARDQQLEGMAVPGLQVDNPLLYKASDRGLSNHIYNSIEYAKSEWRQAAQAGPGASGRMHLGAGLHVVEDYFSHSNFIEVALNRYIDRLIKRSSSSNPTADPNLKKFLHDVKGVQTVQGPGRYVDTLYDAKKTGSSRQVITTGSFGGVDTKVSIAHILLPKLPKLQGALTNAIDRIVGLPIEQMNMAGLKGLLKQDRSVQALFELESGLSKAGVTVPVPTDWSLSMSSPYINITTRETDILSAIPQTAAFVQKLKSEVQSNVLYRVLSAIHDMTKLIEQLIEQIRERIRKAAKAAIAQLMVQLVAGLTGQNPEELAKMAVGDMLGVADTQVSKLEQESSIKSRLQPGGDLAELPVAELEKTIGPVQGGPGHFQPRDPLPPSHSEISKDHPPHKERLVKSHPHDPGEPEHADGSLFYGLHRMLAVEADRHVFLQLQAVWSAEQGPATDRSLLGDGTTYQTTTRVSHDQVNEQAGRRAEEEKARAKADGLHYGPRTQDDREYLRRRPQVQTLLNLADLFISHPDDSSWWHIIFDQYVSQHEPEVVAHIRARNRVRGKRQ